jgi:aminopeptidase N
MKSLALCCLFLLCAFSATAQYTRQDTLRGSNGRGRDWWDVVFYELSITVDTMNHELSGYMGMNFHIIGEPRDSMQIDLQQGMELELSQGDEGGPNCCIRTDGNVKWIILDRSYWKRRGARRKGDSGLIYTINFYFHGKPRSAINPPWDGGLIWTKDSAGKPWIAVACQGIGASSWWPCKDYQGDEPEHGISMRVFAVGDLKIVSNGKKGPPADTIFCEQPNGSGRFDRIIHPEGPFWYVRNPINTYNVSFYIGDYAHWHDTLRGEKGVLDLDFHPLKYNLARAKKHWAVTKDMLRCFEHWFGPYPFYEDGYKLVEAPYLGMEHQSAIAYGNGYQMGYRGRDIFSRTGIGLSFDYIIIHESAHEWFGNSITARDPAENWLHESFATYGEALFAEWILGKDSAFRYTRGQWKMIRHDGRDVLGPYGVNSKASSDIYCKGSAVLHMIRMMLHDDEKFRQLLRGMSKHFYHQIVSGNEVEAYLSSFCGMNLAPFFNQYLRHPGFPIVHAKQSGESIRLDLRGYDESFKLPVYDQNGKFVCELSRKPVRIPIKDLPALKNYLIMYDSEPGTIALPPN